MPVGGTSKTARTAKEKVTKTTTTTSKKAPLKPKENAFRDDSDNDDAVEMDQDDDFDDDARKPGKTLKAPSRQGKDASDVYQSVCGVLHEA